MTDRLQELLDPTPTEDERKKSNGWRWKENAIVRHRLALVRETMGECLKMSTVQIVALLASTESEESK